MSHVNSALGKKAPAGAGGIRRWLATVFVSVVALVLTLVVISLSVGSSLPRTVLSEYFPVKANDPRKLSSVCTDGNKNDTGIAAPLPGEVFQGGKEPLAEHNAPMNSSEACLNTREN